MTNAHDSELLMFYFDFCFSMDVFKFKFLEKFYIFRITIKKSALFPI